MDDPRIAVMQKRLAVLNSMPQTGHGSREIIALERTISMLRQGVPQQQKKEKKAAIAKKKLAKLLDDVEEETEIQPQAPLRSVEQVEGKKRVIIRTPRKDELVAENEDADLKRENQKRMGDILSMVGLTRRAMN